MTANAPKLSEAKAALIEKYMRGEMPQSATIRLRWDEGVHLLVVQIQEGAATQRPFFFLHSDLRDSGIYCVKLARALDPDRPFYAIHPSGTDGTPVAYTLEEIAAEHLAALRAIQPDGPYLLGGFCGGAAVAFEMAQQLQAQGERVDALALIEQGVAHAETRLARALIGRLGNLLGLDRETQVQLFLHLRKAYMEKSPRALLPDRIRTFTRAESPWMKHLERLSRILPSGFRRVQPFFTLPADDPRAIRARTTFDLECRYMWAITGYVPRHYHGRVAMFWACDEHGKPFSNRVKGWENVAEELDVYATPGTHFSAITTHAEELAAQMRMWLDAGEASTERV